MIVGYTYSSVEGKIGGSNNADYYVIRVSESGTLQWAKCFGGSDDDYGEAVSLLDDGLLVVGDSLSRDGQASENHGSFDYLVLKVDLSGNLIWSKCYGGSGEEHGYDLVPVDGGGIAIGYTDSSDGQVSGNHGRDDVWAVRFDGSGNSIWAHCYGGSDGEEAFEITRTPDGKYLIAGTSQSSNGDVSANFGLRDVWVLEIDNSGNLIWQKNAGGSGDEYGHSVASPLQGNIVISGYTNSNDHDVSGNHGLYDMWALSLMRNPQVITASAGIGGSISPSGSVPVAYGQNQPFVIHAETNYEISSVVVDGHDQGPIQSYTFTNVTSGHTIVASFTHVGNEYSINATADSWTINDPVGLHSYPSGTNHTQITQAKPGAYLVNVTVDSIGKGPVSSWTFTDISANHEISTTGVPKPGQILVLFNASIRSGNAPVSVTFEDKSCGDPTAWFWQFGDGQTSSQQHPTHSYTSPGLYSVTLRAMKNQAGGYGIWNNFISVTSGTEPQPTPTPVPGEIISAFSASPVNGTAPLTVQFTDQSTGNPTGWLWDFGEGTSSRLQNPSHEYAQAGGYSVSVLAENSRYSGSITKQNLIVVT